MLPITLFSFAFIVSVFYQLFSVNTASLKKQTLGSTQLRKTYKISDTKKPIFKAFQGNPEDQMASTMFLPAGPAVKLRRRLMFL